MNNVQIPFFQIVGEIKINIDSMDETEWLNECIKPEIKFSLELKMLSQQKCEITHKSLCSEVKNKKKCIKNST